MAWAVNLLGFCYNVILNANGYIDEKIWEIGQIGQKWPKWIISPLTFVWSHFYISVSNCTYYTSSCSKFNSTKTVLVQFRKNQEVKILFGIKWKDVRKNDKFRQIFRGVPNIPNYLECFYGRRNIHICIPNIPVYKMIPKSLKLTVYLWNNQHFNKKCQGNLMFLTAIWWLDL